MGAHKALIGLAGGIGAGKSAVAQELRRLGACVIVADEISQQELDKQEVRDTLVKWFGPDILGVDGKVARGALADVVFSDSAQRLRVERLLHPRVAARRAELTEQAQADPAIKAIVLDSPLLFEVGLNLQCDAVIFVDTPESVRVARLAATRGWAEAEMHRREKAHKPLDFKKERSDYIVENGSGRDRLREQVDAVFSKILSMKTSGSGIQADQA